MDRDASDIYRPKKSNFVLKATPSGGRITNYTQAIARHHNKLDSVPTRTASRRPFCFRFVMDEYEVLEMVGEGSFGRVYKAVHRVQRNLVALKFIPKVSSASVGETRVALVTRNCNRTDVPLGYSPEANKEKKIKRNLTKQYQGIAENRVKLNIRHHRSRIFQQSNSCFP